MRNLSRAVAVQLTVILLIGVAIAWAAHRFPVVEYITRAQHHIGGLEWWSGVLYPVLLAACNLLLLPGGVLSVGSGLFFGLWWGFFLVWLGTILGAALAFAAGRFLGRQRMEKLISANGKWQRLDKAIAREGWKIIFLSQVHPLFPTSILNYFYGMTKVRFRTCMLWIALGQAPGLFLYVYLGTLTQHGLRLLRGKSDPTGLEYAIWIGGLVVTVIVTTALGRIALRILREIHGTKKIGTPVKSSAPPLDRDQEGATVPPTRYV